MKNRKAKSVRALIISKTLIHLVVLFVVPWALSALMGEVTYRYITKATSVMPMNIVQIAKGIPNSNLDMELKTKDAQLIIMDENFNVTKSMGVAIETQPAFDKVELAQIVSNANEHQEYIATFAPIDAKSSALLLENYSSSKRPIDMVGVFILVNIGVNILVFIGVLLSFTHSIYKPIKKNFAVIEESISKIPYDETKVEVTASTLSEGRNVLQTYNVMLDKLVKARKEKESAVMVNRQLISNLAHDLKSPITVLKGYAEVLSQEKLTRKEQKEYVSYIEKSANDLNSLTNLLFEQTKYQNADIMNLETADLNSVLRDVCANYYIIFDKNGFEFNSDIEEIAFETKIDIINLRRVFSNLLQNILNHNQTPTKVKVASQTEDDCLVIQVMDDGVGIKQENAEHIFEAFFQEDTVRNTQNSGLGLYVCREIIKQHKGEITLCKNAEYKTVFRIQIPKA